MYVNLYGPTEVTVDCTYYIVDREFADDEPVPIGRACRNMEVFLLDENNRLITASGKAGEICVRTGVALGYYRDPKRTAESFCPEPVKQRLPRSGLPDGEILPSLMNTGSLSFAAVKMSKSNTRGTASNWGNRAGSLQPGGCGGLRLFL